MTASLNLPPLYTAIVAGSDADAVMRAAALAEEGADAATFVWSSREDQLDCAVVLRPEEGESAERVRAVLPVAVLALDDAIGRVGPPGLDTDLRWPDTVRVNGGRAASVRLVEGPAGAGGAPSWLVVGAAVRIAPVPGIEGGERPDQTSLRDEGCAEATSRELAEAYSRTLVYWTDRWLDDGFAVAARHWRHRLTKYAEDIALIVGGEPVAGTVEGLDDNGNLILNTSEGRRTISLAEALRSA